MASPTTPGTGFVGRTDEAGTLREALDGARRGVMSAVLVTGDAGVGKTRLVDHVCPGSVRCEPADGELVVLRGTCLPLTATSVPLVALRTAFRRLPSGLDAPELGRRDAAGDAPLVVDDWVERVCASRPVVLVVDDVHWADPASRDVLTYLVAGPANRPLAVLMTLRRGETGIGDPFQRWLADLRRMPAYTEVALAPFDRESTREQLTGLLGTSPHESLVSDVQARSGGNAYLNRLLVEGLPGDARHVPAGLPQDLRGAVLRSWTRLPPAARELVQAVAVGGEVATGAALQRASRIVGRTSAEVIPLLREAVDAGVLDPLPDGGYWFHHPLQAEALEESLAAEERRVLHAAFADACEADLDRRSEASGPRLAALAAVAEHHRLAGDLGSAFHWGLRAAAVAEAIGDLAALVPTLDGLVRLHPELDDPGVPLSELLLRLRDAAAGIGDHETEHRATEALLDALDPARAPLLVAELVVRREHLRFSTGRGFLHVAPMARAVELARVDPGSWQYGYALAELAHAQLWADAPEAHATVDAALAHAEASGHPRALLYARVAAAMRAEIERVPGAVELGRRGVAAAVEARDWWGFVHATLWEANGCGLGRPRDWAATAEVRRRQLQALGAPHPYVAWLSAVEATMLLGTGDWRRSTECLRVALGSDPGVGADVSARLGAARLATLQGRQEEAEKHLARAEELFVETSDFLAFEFDAVRAMVALAAGDPDRALDATMTGLWTPGLAPTLCEWLCPLAARALADAAERRREDGADPADVLARLDELVARLPHVVADNGWRTPEYRRMLDALDAWYAAEVARARRDPEEATRWLTAVELLDGPCPWDASYAALRAGEALLVRAGAGREDAAAMLRRAWTLASELKAEPVLREVRELAASCRITLETPEAGDAPSAAALPGLTPREREVLDHVVAGRTYGEIARALFVSEKTVSSHISNLLRKTGAANRVELAQRARRAADRHP